MASLAPVGFCVVSLYSIELNTLQNYHPFTLPNFFFLSNFCARLRTPTEPVRWQGRADIPEGQMSERRWQTNLEVDIGPAASSAK